MLLNVQSVEAVDEGDGSFFGDFRFYMFSDGCGAKYTKILSFLFAMLIGLDGSDEQIISIWVGGYF